MKKREYVGIRPVGLYKCNQCTNSLGTCAVDELLNGQQHQRSWIGGKKVDLKDIHHIDKI